jgi:hypothetical protein
VNNGWRIALVFASGGMALAAVLIQLRRHFVVSWRGVVSIYALLALSALTMGILVYLIDS